MPRQDRERADGRTPSSRTYASRRLAYVLRHDPGSVGLTLGPGGWVSVDDLIAACTRHGIRMDTTLLDSLVHAPGKRRYSYDETGTLVRASQGHSVPVDLGLDASEPPAVLFHGTTDAVSASIEREGLRAGTRQHVHLSATRELAEIVGARRRGSVVVFEVDAAAMFRDGHSLFVAENGVWLTSHVPPRYLTRRT